MKKIIAFSLCLFCILFLFGCDENSASNRNSVFDDPAAPEKPVIYLYPEEETDVRIELDFNGELASTYPAYNGAWNVTAKPDGTLLGEDGREYYCLFWEGTSYVNYKIEQGFVVPGTETEKFLEESLRALGLTDKEANEFIIYWLPRMEHNSYNLISFLGEQYTDNAALHVSPAPDSVLRVFMVFKALDEPVSIAPQELEGIERNGFTHVEWGGAEIK